MIKNKNEARLAQGYKASPQYSYDKLVDSTTWLNTSRKPYITFRMLNNVQGLSIRRQWKQADKTIAQRNGTIQNKRRFDYLL